MRSRGFCLISYHMAFFSSLLNVPFSTCTIAPTCLYSSFAPKTRKAVSRRCFVPTGRYSSLKHPRCMPLCRTSVASFLAFCFSSRVKCAMSGSSDSSSCSAWGSALAENPVRFTGNCYAQLGSVDNPPEALRQVYTRSEPVPSDSIAATGRLQSELL